MIGIINYRAGNLQNLANALDFIGAESKILDGPQDIGKMDKLILPGVGAFGHAADNLKKYGFWDAIKEAYEKGTPILGICVGMQLLFSKGTEEGEHEGLGLIEGDVTRFDHDLKIPQMGWNRPEFNDPSNPLLKDIAPGSWFYFVHSYACYPKDQSQWLAKANYGNDFCAMANRNKLWGVQFHPEKSQEPGLQLLKNFCEDC